MSAVYLAAGFPVEAVRLWVDEIDGFEEVLVQVEVVVTWRIDEDDGEATAVPVFLETRMPGETIVLKMPDGRFLSPEEGSYSDLDSAKAEVLESYRRRNAALYQR